MTVPEGAASTAFRALTAAVTVAAVTVAAVAACDDRSFAGRGEPGDDIRDERADARAVEAQERRRIVFLGTSLTAGFGLLRANEPFPARIQARIDSTGLPYRVVNAGRSGDTSADARRRMVSVLAGGPIDVLVLELGANDGLRGIPPAELARNLEGVVRRVRERNPDVAILVLGMEAPPSRDPSYRQAFRAVFPDVAGRHDATLVPFVLEDVVGREDRVQADGIHPNVGGHRMIAERVWDHLLPVLHESGEG